MTQLLNKMKGYNYNHLMTQLLNKIKGYNYKNQ